MSVNIHSGGIFDEGRKRERLAELDYLSAQNEFWENQEYAQTLLKERTQIKNHLDRLDNLQSQLDDIEILMEMAAEDPECLIEADETTIQTEQLIEKMEFEYSLSKKAYSTSSTAKTYQYPLK